MRTVKFNVELLKSRADEKETRALFQKVFDECIGRSNWGTIVVICTVAQYGAWVIERNKMRVDGRPIQNRIADDDPTFMYPTGSHVMDFTKKQNPSEAR